MVQATAKERALVVIVGPTASGKSCLAMAVALMFGGEIVSADSRQVYRHMDLGTGKASPAERVAVAHHLVDIVDPDEPFTAADYQRLACQAIEEIHRRGRLPILVGGTGLYIRAVTEGLSLAGVAPDRVLRERLEARAREIGPEALHAELVRVDPWAAAGIDMRNTRRVVRALEVYHLTGVNISRRQTAISPGYRLFKMGLTMDRQELYRRIDARVDQMIDRGLLHEVEGLLASGHRPESPALSALGYRQIVQHLQGQCTLEEAVGCVKTGTHRFARQQYTWFRLDDTRIRWFDAENDIRDAALESVAHWRTEERLHNGA